MQPTGESTIQVKRRIIVVLIVLPLFSGFAAFINILGSPQFQDIRSLDGVRLIAIGACCGVAVAGLALLIGARVRKGWRANNRFTPAYGIAPSTIAVSDVPRLVTPSRSDPPIRESRNPTLTRATPNARISAMSGVQSLADQKADRSWITRYPEAERATAGQILADDAVFSFAL